jgi:hypothetical protein
MKAIVYTKYGAPDVLELKGARGLEVRIKMSTRGLGVTYCPLECVLCTSHWKKSEGLEASSSRMSWIWGK